METSSSLPATLSSPWLAASTRPQHEQAAAAHFREHGWPVFLPVQPVWRHWSDRKKLLHVPLFPSYVFVAPPVEQRKQAVSFFAVRGWVRNAQGPLPVATHELEAIACALRAGIEFDPLAGVHPGDEVEIVAGAMRGHRGILLSAECGSIALMVHAIGGGIRIRVPDATWLRRPRSNRGA